MLPVRLDAARLVPDDAGGLAARDPGDVRRDPLQGTREYEAPSDPGGLRGDPGRLRGDPGSLRGDPGSL